MKSNEKWFFFIYILLLLIGLWLLNETLRPPVNPGIPPQITGSLDLPLDDARFVISRYRQLELVTGDPYIISPEVWLLCTAPSLQEEALLESEHAGLSVRLYANAEALPYLEAGEGRVFPKGTVLVKEKLLSPDDLEPVALGIMVKAESGFNREGEWEFAYWLAGEEPIIGNDDLPECVRCHSQQSATDMVFRQQ